MTRAFVLAGQVFSQQPQLVRRGRLAEPDELRQVADAQLPVRERVEPFRREIRHGLRAHPGELQKSSGGVEDRFSFVAYFAYLRQRLPYAFGLRAVIPEVFLGTPQSPASVFRGRVEAFKNFVRDGQMRRRFGSARSKMRGQTLADRQHPQHVRVRESGADVEPPLQMKQGEALLDARRFAGVNPRFFAQRGVRAFHPAHGQSVQLLRGCLRSDVSCFATPFHLHALFGDGEKSVHAGRKKLLEGERANFLLQSLAESRRMGGGKPISFQYAASVRKSRVVRHVVFPLHQQSRRAKTFAVLRLRSPCEFYLLPVSLTSSFRDAARYGAFFVKPFKERGASVTTPRVAVFRRSV